MQVEIIQDWHGLYASVDRQIELLHQYAPNARETAVLHEPLTCSHTNDIFEFSIGEITFENFWKTIDLENHWGPSECYKKLYLFLHNSGYSIAPLDHYLEERMQLSAEFRDLIVEYLKERDRSNVKSRLSPLFDSLKRDLSFERESVFCGRVDNIKYENPKIKKAVVITHPAHVKRCYDYLKNTQNYKVQVAKVKSDLAKQFSKDEDELQLIFAERNRILDMEKPPLVPTVVTAFTEVKF